MDELRESGLHVSIAPAQKRDSERWNRTLSDFLQPMIDWIAESQPEAGTRGSRKSRC